MGVAARYWDFYDRYVVTVRRDPEYPVNRYYAHLLDPFLTKWAHDFGLSPNAVTTLGLFAGLGCAVALLNGSFLAAAALLQLHHLLDGADGNLARLTDRCTESGARYDQWSDRTTRIAVFGALAWAAPVSSTWALAFLTILVLDHIVVHAFILPFMSTVSLKRARWKAWFLDRGLIPGFDHFTLFFLVSACAVVGRLDLAIYFGTSLKALDVGYRLWECLKSAPRFEDLEEINRTAKPVDFWTVDFDYWFSTRLVSLVRSGPITPDHLTYASFSSGLLGATVLLLGPAQWSTLVVAALLFQTAYILDCADGQLARVREEYSRHGWRLDLYSDRITETVILLSTTAYVARENAALWGLGFATLGATTLLQYARIHELMNAASFNARVPEDFDATGHSPQSALREPLARFEARRRKFRLGFLNVGNFYCLNFLCFVAGAPTAFLVALLVLALAATVYLVCQSTVRQDELLRGLAQVEQAGHSAVLFGAGKGAAQFMTSFQNRGIQLACVCDNNSARWGDRFFGVPIEDPSTIARDAGGVTVFIASEWAGEIRSQLVGYGIPDEHITSLY
ncbi:MAG: CDP-alcohol phosphatidyltransferase family protein [Myxococcota bacterium]|jgi:phosphatidylglycerophosphate synthase|nr:CDP-alcohol phosphatidyltransferase family protein [Myxococcota bacterium]